MGLSFGFDSFLQRNNIYCIAINENKGSKRNDFGLQERVESPKRVYLEKKVSSSTLSSFNLNFNHVSIDQIGGQRRLSLRTPLKEEYEIIEEMYMEIDASFDDKMTKTKFFDLVNEDYVEIQGKVHHLRILELNSTDNKIIGLVHIIFEKKSFQKNDFFCELEGIYVSSEFRRQGFGQLLGTYAIKQAVANQASSITLSSTHLGAYLYAKLGFIPLQTSSFQEEWLKLSTAQKVKVYQETFKVKDRLDLVLDLTHPDIRSRFWCKKYGLSRKSVF